MVLISNQGIKKTRTAEIMKKISGFDELTAYSGGMIFARYYENSCFEPYDYKIIDFLVEKINTRQEDACFGLLSLLRIYKQLPISDEYKQKMKLAAIKYEYKIDDKNPFEQCLCEMFAGSFWPEEYFEQHDSRGIDRYKECYSIIDEYLDTLEKYDCGDFGYEGEPLDTICGLLMLYDFSNNEDSTRRVKKLADKFISGAQNLESLHYMTGKSDVEVYDVRLATFAFSSYGVPSNV